LKFIGNPSKSILQEQPKNKSLAHVKSVKLISVPTSIKDISTEASEAGEKNVIEENYK
jgi:hypothetical protein